MNRRIRRIRLHAFSAFVSAGAVYAAAGMDPVLIAAFAAAAAASLELFRLPRVEVRRASPSDAAAFALSSLSGSMLAGFATWSPAAASAGACALSAWMLGIGAARLAAERISRPGERRALLVDSPDSGLLRAALRATGAYDEVGWLSSEPESRYDIVEGLPVLGSLDELPYLVEWHRIEALLAVRPEDPGELERLRTLTEVAGVELTLLPGSAELLAAPGRRTARRTAPQPRLTV